MPFLSKLFGNPNLREIKKVEPLVALINALEKDFEKLTAEELKAKTKEFKERLGAGETSDDILPEAFAAAREAAKRAIGQRHFDVQLVGAVFLHKGYIAEMRTGEGKTLTSTAAVYLNALEGRGAHVVTVNDYLAKRDTVWMGKIYHALGLTVGCIQQQMGSYVYEPGYEENLNPKISLAADQPGAKPEEEAGVSLVKVEPTHLRPCNRRQAYQCDITYGTNNEYGFDYLRDNMATSLGEMAQRDLHYAIVDEVDSILIDEARTPLIISAPAEEATDKYYKFAELVSRLAENEDYNIDEKLRAATFTEAGIIKLEQWLNLENIYAEGGVQTVHHLEQALKAHTLFKRDRDYVVVPAKGGSASGGKDGEIIIVDEFTGRLMFGRRYSEGLHQAIEAKEKVPIQRESQTLATITFQNYFRLYKKMAGMTGTAATEAEEFAKIYNLEVVEIPTHRPMVRRDLSDRIYKNENGKFTAVTREVKERHTKGQPVLIGTISIEKNELLSEMLAKEGIPHEILNAKNHEREAEIIAQAGRWGAVTLATNMAGRGVDIVFGGNLESRIAELKSRVTDPAELAQEMEKMKAEWQAEREKVASVGGLHVLGTERHESRRIDNQLRGRSGRQGDPGSSQFYVSLEDDLMRIFGSEKIKRMMEFLRVPEDMPIENRMVSRSLESAQHKVEGNNFDIRKHLLDYDDVLNKHRGVIYRKRREILEEYEKEKAGLGEGASNEAGREAGGEADRAESVVEPGGKEGVAQKGEGENVMEPGGRESATAGSVKSVPDGGRAESALKRRILEMVEKEIEEFVYFHTGGSGSFEWNLKEILETAATIFPVSEEEKQALFKIGESKAEGRLAEAAARTDIIEFLNNVARARYGDLEKQVNNRELMLELEKAILLRSIDTLWVEHLVAIDYLRAGIGLRGYGQRDPLVEYKKETYRLFNELISLIQKEVVYSVYKVGIGVELTPSLMERQGVQIRGAAKEAGAGGGSEGAGVWGAAAPKEFSRDASGAKVGRNDPCPCGSGKKYKKCHGIS
ncbi:MAG: preprotein translocase subunit SecA [Candidatus Magasanikbacteria bacterium]|nr:preprotein translocase subunit SecA [Candidatus Magasanikbacteria bacterium]